MKKYTGCTGSTRTRIRQNTSHGTRRNGCGGTGFVGGNGLRCLAWDYEREVSKRRGVTSTRRWYNGVTKYAIKTGYGHAGTVTSTTSGVASRGVRSKIRR